jgi:MFS transporter, DHA2 family, methylenomycin A resistance protein
LRPYVSIRIEASRLAQTYIWTISIKKAHGMHETLLSHLVGRTSHHRSLTLLTLCLAVLVAQVDTAVVNLALRPIGEYFSAGVGALQWVVDSYNLVYAVLLLTGGLLADLKGRRLMFMIGATIFTAASLACAVAPSIAVLIAARAVAGIGAALLIPASLAIIRVVWRDPAERGRALGIWAGCNGLAMAIGPTLGGVLIRYFGWPSVFLVVVPFGLATLGLAPLAIPESADPQDRRFDAAAQILGALALGGLALAAIESHTAPSIALAALVAAAIALALFINIEDRRGRAALVPLDIFRIPRFRSAVTATAGMTFGMYGVLFLLPLTWQESGRLDAAGAGLALMPMALIFVAVSPFSGTLSRHLGVRFMIGGGLAIISSGLLLIGLGAHQSSILPAELGLSLTGVGMGLATGPLMGEAVGAVAAARSGTASALINVARMVGATVSVAILGAVFAFLGGGPDGLRAAMILGGLVQIACAAVAWTTTRSAPRQA